MASSTASAATKKAPSARGTNVLGDFMQKLSSSVYLLRPTPDLSTNATGTPPTTSTAPDPTLILMFGWMNASETPLAKYVRQYEGMFPRAAIIVIKTSLATMNSPRLGLREARPAAAAARAILEQDGQERGQDQHSHLLVHVFSAAGSCMFKSLRDAYEEGQGDAVDKLLPLHVSIFDSSPTTFSYQKLVGGVLAATPPASLTRLLLFPFAHLFVACWWLAINLALMPDHVGVMAANHNDRAHVHDARRLYIYSHADLVVPSSDIEAHAADAKAKGFDVKLEVFEGSGHVAHGRKHAVQYWQVVRQAWEKSQL